MLHHKNNISEISVTSAIVMNLLGRDLMTGEIKSRLTCWTFSKSNQSDKHKYGQEYQTSNKLGGARLETLTLVL